MEVSVNTHKPQEPNSDEEHSQPTEEPENATPKLTDRNQVSHISLHVFISQAGK